MTITIRRSEERGHIDHGWLDAWHTFSFADYRDPEFVSFGPLRVLNHDTIRPGTGFGAHGHDNMEIVTYVLRGAVAHEDSMGNGSRIPAGEVQLMSAGHGVRHSEHNPSDEDDLELLQMWVIPAARDTAPRWEQRPFDVAGRHGSFVTVASSDGRDGSLRIGNDVTLHAAVLHAGEEAVLELAPGRRAWVHVARGRVHVDDRELGGGDGAAIEGRERIRFVGQDEAELVVWDVA